MKEIKLIKGCGRTGNFIICLLNAIVYAIKNDYDEIDFSKIHWSPSPTINNTIMNSFFKQYRIPLSEAARSVKQVENDKTHVFEISTERFYRTVPLTFEERIKYIKKYISPIMKLTPQKIGVNDLVIHLRSGDIIVSGNSDMIQPPLEFYIKVIESRKWDKIYVITERKPLNPIFNALVKRIVSNLPPTFNSTSSHDAVNLYSEKIYLPSSTKYLRPVLNARVGPPS